MQVYFKSDEVLPCIVTCGGLCPGLNTVIREIVCGLSHMYGVNKVLGIDVSGIFAISLILIYCPLPYVLVKSLPWTQHQGLKVFVVYLTIHGLKAPNLNY